MRCDLHCPRPGSQLGRLACAAVIVAIAASSAVDAMIRDFLVMAVSVFTGLSVLAVIVLGAYLVRTRHYQHIASPAEARQAMAAASQPPVPGQDRVPVENTWQWTAVVTDVKPASIERPPR